MSCRNIKNGLGSLTIVKNLVAEQADKLRLIEAITPNGYKTIGDVKKRLIELANQGVGFGTCVQVQGGFISSFNNDSEAYVWGNRYMITRIDSYADASHCQFMASRYGTDEVYILGRVADIWKTPQKLSYSSTTQNSSNMQTSDNQLKMGGITHFALGDYAVTVMQKGGQQHELQNYRLEGLNRTKSMCLQAHFSRWFRLQSGSINSRCVLYHVKRTFSKCRGAANRCVCGNGLYWYWSLQQELPDLDRLAETINAFLSGSQCQQSRPMVLCGSQESRIAPRREVVA